MSNYKIFTGTAHPTLAMNIAAQLDTKLGQSFSSQFADGETRVMIQESARGDDVYLVQPTCERVNDNLMELCIMADAFKRASVQSITAVIPYFGYARQDKKVKPREPITAKLVADFLQIAGVTRVLTVDIHSEQIQGFFDIPMDHLYAGPTFVSHLKSKGFVGDEYVAVSPDVGGTSRAANLAKHLNTEFAVVTKSRPRPNEVQTGKIIGDVEDKHCIMIDDMMDTASTLVTQSNTLENAGAYSVHVCCTHPVLSKGASERLRDCKIIKTVTCLDTVPISDEKRAILGDKLVVLPSAPLIAAAIDRHHKHESVSSLFSEWRS